MSSHEDYFWTAGDDWQIDATLVNSDGDVFDLSIGSPTIKWSLVSEVGELKLTEADCEIVVTNGAAGECSIKVPAAKTAPLSTGRYIDQIRILYGTKTSTLSHGWNWITNDAWTAAAG